VADMLRLSAELKGIAKSDRRRVFDFAVQASGINEVFYRTIRELSKGYKQRVGLAVALLNEPDVIIMDEPTEGLDPNQRGDIRSVIKELSRDHTVIVSTHVMVEAAAVCNRLLIINHGQLVADGAPDELMQQAAGNRVLQLEVEGEDVASLLETVDGVMKVEEQSRSSGRSNVKVFAEQQIELQPLISKIDRDRQWVIWRLMEEERSLEDVFGELTKGENV